MITDIFNLEFLSGGLMILIGLLSSTKLFGGRKLSIILILVVVLILWNIVWISSSRIYLLEMKHNKRNNTSVLYNELEMTIFDRIMYRGNSVLTFTIYQLYIVAGPIDICKSHMLQFN